MCGTVLKIYKVGKSFFYYPQDIFVQQNLCFDNIGITKSQLCFTMHRKLNQRVKQPGNLDWMIPSVTSMNMVYYFNAPHILGQTQRSPCHQFPTGLQGQSLSFLYTHVYPKTRSERNLYSKKQSRPDIVKVLKMEACKRASIFKTFTTLCR